MALSKEELIEEIKQMSVIDLSEVVKALEEEFGVSAAAPVAVAAAAPAGGDAGQAAEGGEAQSEFTVTLKDVGANKIAVIKLNRPKLLNAVNEQLVWDLQKATEDVKNDDDIIAKGIATNFFAKK